MLQNLLFKKPSSGNYTHKITVGECEVSDPIMAYGYATSSVSGYDMGAITPATLGDYTIAAVYCIDARHYAQMQWSIILSGSSTDYNTVKLTYGDYSIELYFSDYNVQTRATTYSLDLYGGDDDYDAASSIVDSFVTGKQVPITLEFVE